MDFSFIAANNSVTFDIVYVEPFNLNLGGGLNFVRLDNNRTEVAGLRRLAENDVDKCPDGEYLEKNGDTTTISVFDEVLSGVYVGCDEDANVVVSLLIREPTHSPTQSPTASSAVPPPLPATFPL